MEVGDLGKSLVPPRPFAHRCVLPGGGLGTRASHVRETAGVFPKGELMAWPSPFPGL